MALFPAYLVLLLIAIGSPQTREVPLFDFGVDRGARNWYVVTDAVTGGASRGEIGPGRGNYVRFSGRVAAADTSGFVSFWSREAAMDLSRFAGLALRVRGDGKTYKVALKMGKGVDAIQYMARITPPRSGWSVVRVRFRELLPMLRGAILSDARRFDPAQTMALGVMIADRQEGVFELMVERISVYAD
jgi:monofunctional biosynthetic peptidoglycan transglycosylase